jgi:hypothetical protein
MTKGDSDSLKGKKSRGTGASWDFDFRYHLYDTLILLGGRKEIADLLARSQDYAISESQVNELRKYNASLIDETKDRLVNIHTIKIRTKGK